MSSQRHADRLAMGGAAVLSVAQASALLPLADSEAREFLRREGLVRHVEGRAVVVWSAVIAAIERGDRTDAGPKPGLPSLPHVRLD